MRLYLDDDLAWPLLTSLLRKAGHDVCLPADMGAAGAKDPVHLSHAVRQARVCLTRDYSDYQLLHNLIMVVGGHHPGILVVRQENDRKKDLGPPGIVRAIGKLEASNYALADQYEVLNHWR